MPPAGSAYVGGDASGERPSCDAVATVGPVARQASISSEHWLSTQSASVLVLQSATHCRPARAAACDGASP